MKNVLYFLVLGLAFSLSSCTPYLQLSQTDATSISANSQVREDSSILALISPYKEKMEEKMDVSIGHLSMELIKAKPESTLGNWTADVVHKKCADYTKESVDFAVVNYGGLRIPSIPAGEITKGKIFELMPFDNILVVMELDGPTTLQLFGAMAAAGGWPISKQVRYKIQAGKAVGIMINGEPLDLAKSYKVALSDYLANGGDRLSFLIDKPRKSAQVLFREALIQYVEEQEGRAIEARIEGRVIIEK